MISSPFTFLLMVAGSVFIIIIIASVNCLYYFDGGKLRKPSFIPRTFREVNMTRRQCGVNEVIVGLFTMGVVLILGSTVWVIYQTITTPVPVVVTCDIPLALRTIRECTICHPSLFEVHGILQGCAANGTSIVLRAGLIGYATAEGVRHDFPLRASVVMENGFVYLGERSDGASPGMRYFLMSAVFDGVVGVFVAVCVLGVRGPRTRGPGAMASASKSEELPSSVVIAQEEVLSA
jgi:hypothetical protein